jgi:two-component system, NarL family, response regulator LiaR
MADRIRLLIVDDHPILRQGLLFALDAKFGIEVIGEAKNGLEAIEKAVELMPDVILMDLLMPKMDGLDAIKEIKQKNPSQKILVLTSFIGDGKLISAVKNGALGYILKDSPPEELIHAILEVAKGNLYLQQNVAAELAFEMQSPSTQPVLHANLTEKELEILKSLANGLSNKDIAGLMNITVGTARAHVSSILSKLNLESRTQAALYARQQGLIDF